MGFLNWVAAKALGVPTVEQRCERLLGEILGKNGLSWPRVTCYKLDRSTGMPGRQRRVYVGTARRDDDDVGVVIVIDEGLSYARGTICDASIANEHQQFARRYPIDPDARISPDFGSYLLVRFGGEQEQLLDTL